MHFIHICVSEKPIVRFEGFFFLTEMVFVYNIELTFFSTYLYFLANIPHKGILCYLVINPLIHIEVGHILPLSK